VLNPSERFLIPGATVKAEAVGYFTADSGVEAGFRVRFLHGGTWHILYVKKLLYRGRVHHLEAYLKRVEASG